MEKFRSNFYSILNGGVETNEETGIHTITLVHGWTTPNGHLTIESNDLDDVNSLVDYIKSGSTILQAQQEVEEETK
tara:strand:+ start:680 stop:907 length:228 start_codon:yes stop_codon:yes gene_type:complete